ncbi:hypothetical protein M8J76_007585 [Diaphorina citri]|nr:hypothetical protein M8J76_007585 [Diaphorina citri]
MMTMSINMGSISNNASNSNMAYYNNSEYNGQYYTHDSIPYNNMQDPYTYQHNQYNHNPQYNYHHHHTSSNKIKNDQILKKFNQFLHNDLTNTATSCDTINDNIVTVCNGLSYTNLDYHYNEHLFRKHPYETPCQQYQKHERFHEFYSESSQDRRDQFVDGFKDRAHEHVHSKENYIGYDAMSEKEPLHAEHETVCTTIPHRTADHFMHPSEHFDPTSHENTSLELANKGHFHENLSLNSKESCQHIERHPNVKETHFEEAAKPEEHFIEQNTRRTIIKETNPCAELDKSTDHDKCEEFIQYDREYYGFNNDVAKSRKSDKVSEKEALTNMKTHYSSIISPVNEYCHPDYSTEYYNDVNIKEEEYDLGNYYHNDYYHSSHTIPPHSHQDMGQTAMSSCNGNSMNRNSNDSSQAGNSTASNCSKTVVPTYKWMQVKRNVPKPQVTKVQIPSELSPLGVHPHPTSPSTDYTTPLTALKYPPSAALREGSLMGAQGSSPNGGLHLQSGDESNP